ncbi:MAG: hypothetical protein ACKPJD_21325, partial [Planctomycetaceae bacterium]
FLVAIITFFAGVLVWKEREARLDDVYDALPFPTWIMYSGKLLCLTLIVLLVLLTGMFAGMVTQAANGYQRFQVFLYLTELPGLDLFRMFCLMVLAMLSHVVAPNKYLGYFLFVVLLLADSFVWLMLGVESQLVNFGSLPDYTYSDLYLFAPFSAGLRVFAVYWLLFAVLVSIGATLYWQRGRETRVRLRLSAALSRWRGPIRWTSLLVLSGWAFTGVWIWYNTQVLNAYQTAEEREDLRERYERELKAKHEGRLQPRTVQVRYEIDLYPEQRAIELRGAETLLNRESVPLTQLCLNL